MTHRRILFFFLAVHNFFFSFLIAFNFRITSAKCNLTSLLLPIFFVVFLKKKTFFCPNGFGMIYWLSDLILSSFKGNISFILNSGMHKIGLMISYQFLSAYWPGALFLNFFVRF